MFIYEKKLQYPVKIRKPDLKAASIIISQLGGPDGELGAATRYLAQRFSMPYREVSGLLTDIGTCVSSCVTPLENPHNYAIFTFRQKQQFHSFVTIDGKNERIWRVKVSPFLHE